MQGKQKEISMEIVQSSPSFVPFSLLFMLETVPTPHGDQTVGAETATQTSKDGIVKKDAEEDEDVDS